MGKEEGKGRQAVGSILSRWWSRAKGFVIPEME